MIRARIHGGAFIPIGRQPFAMTEGDVVYLTVDRDRSDASHRHEFAWLRSAWESLPESLAGEPFAQSPEHLRKYALVQCGYCDVREIAVGDDDDAKRVRAFIGPLVDRYALIGGSGPVVRIYTARSQSRRAMGAKDFQESKTRIMDYIAGLLGVTAEDLAA
jgi:hypothetical protein